MDIIGGQHLRQMWDDLADVYGHKTALICESSGGVVNRYSYLELNQEINRTANLFYTLGIRKGDKVALHLDNCPEFIFCWFGLAKIGAIMVPINARLLREESAWILQNSQACLLVTSAQFYPMYQQIQQEDATQLRHICLTDVALPADDGVSSFTQLKNQQPATLCYAPPLSTDDTAEILFTSGTTSRPKGVVITHYNLRFAGYYSAWQCALRDDDVYLTVMPAFHIDCQCTAAMAAFSAGATFVLVEKYSARAFWGQVQKYRATVTECIPMMIRTLMVQPPSANDRQHRLREVMFYLNLSEQEKDAFCERFGVRLLTSYGMTETIVGIIGDRPGDKRRWPSIGRAGFCYEAEIRDDHNRPLPAGEIGEICIKGVPGKTIFKEYFLLLLYPPSLFWLYFQQLLRQLLSSVYPLLHLLWCLVAKLSLQNHLHCLPKTSLVLPILLLLRLLFPMRLEQFLPMKVNFLLPYTLFVLCLSCRIAEVTIVQISFHSL